MLLLFPCKDHRTEKEPWDATSLSVYTWTLVPRVWLGFWSIPGCVFTCVNNISWSQILRNILARCTPTETRALWQGLWSLLINSRNMITKDVMRLTPVMDKCIAALYFYPSVDIFNFPIKISNRKSCVRPTRPVVSANLLSVHWHPFFCLVFLILELSLARLLLYMILSFLISLILCF